MLRVGKKGYNWLYLAPILVVVLMFSLALFVVHWYQSSLYAKLEKTAYVNYLVTVENSLKRHVQSITQANKDIFLSDKNQMSDKMLMDFFRTKFYSNDSFTFVYKMQEKQKTLKVLYSSSVNINVGDILPKKKYFLIDKDTVNELLDKYVHYSRSVYDNQHTLHKFFWYFPKRDLVVSVGLVQEKHSIIYQRYIEDITKDISTTRNIIVLVEFIFSIFAAFLVSLVLKRASANFKKAEDKYEKSNEALILSNKALERQLMVDSFTELYNLRTLRKHTNDMITPKLILVDIDDFRRINEYYSQKTIEMILMYMKNTLVSFCAKHSEFNMKAYCTSSNQFGLLEEAPLDTERYEALASELVKLFKGVRIKINNEFGYVEFSCTIGFSLEEYNIYETAITALRRAREAQKDYLCYFKILGENEIFKKQLEGSSFIKKALEEDMVVPFFQPIFDVNCDIVKYECLVRIVNANGTVILPYMFLDISRRIKRYAEIEKILIKKSFDAIENTQHTISINLSSHDMTDGDVSKFIIEEITKRNNAHKIIFEILENENIEHIQRIENFIKHVKSMGVRIAIDDFGSGYSNFSYMLTLKPDYIKLDGSLIKNIHKDTNSFAIVSAIMVFAKKLGIGTIAEFVHSKEVFDTCVNLGVDEFQGFYLGEPKDKF